MAESEILHPENTKLSIKRMIKGLPISKLNDKDENQDLVEKYIALSPTRAQIKKQLTIMHQKQKLDDDRLVDWIEYKNQIGSPSNPFQINDFICEVELKKDHPIVKKEERKAPREKLPELPGRATTQSPLRANQTNESPVIEPSFENYDTDYKFANDGDLKSLKGRQNFKKISFQSYKKGGSNLKKISNSLVMNLNKSISTVENTNPSPPLSPEKGQPQSVEISNMAHLRNSFAKNHHTFIIKEVEKEFSKNDSKYRLPVSSLRLSKVGQSENLDRLNRSENSRVRLKSAMKHSTILLDEDKKNLFPTSKFNKHSLQKNESLIHIEIQKDGSPVNQPDQQSSDVKIPLKQILSSIKPGPGGNSPLLYNMKNPRFSSRGKKYHKSNTYGYTEQSPIMKNDQIHDTVLFDSNLELPSPVTPNNFNFILAGLNPDSSKKTGRSNRSSDIKFKISPAKSGRKELSRSVNYDLQERIKNFNNVQNKIQDKPKVNESFEFPDPCFLSGIDPQMPRREASRSKIGTLNLDRIGTPAKNAAKNESFSKLLPDKIKCSDILDQTSGVLQDLQKEEKELKLIVSECEKSHQKVEDLFTNLRKVDYVNSGVLQIMYNYQKKAVVEQKKEEHSVIAEYNKLREETLAIRHKTETQVIKSVFKRLKQKRKNMLQSIS